MSQREWVRTWLAQHGATAQKALGQHFLVDEGVARRIVEAVRRGGEPSVLEIGPGLGALTGPLLAAGANVLAIELDRAYAAFLQEQWGTAALRVVHGDAARLSWAGLCREAGLPDPLVVAGNLPYYLTGPLVARLWEEDVLPWCRAVFMVQKEVADRLVAEPGQPAAGAQSVMLRTVGEPRALFDVPPEAFFPAPHVASTVIEVTRESAWAPERRETVRRLVRAGFGQRRKTLRRALAAVAPDAAWMAAAGVDSGRRAETLTMAEWARLAAVCPVAAAGEGTSGGGDGWNDTTS
jgi:16S rRNA (adenine1518-N6/adenine1519-N6)-dimethyltransferase